VPISPYATAKLAGEGYARSFHSVYGLQTVALRYFNVFGPRQDPQSQYAAVIPNFITALLKGESPVIFGDGEQSRDFTYVANVVHANMLAIEAPDLGGKIYNVACGERITLNRLVAELRELLGSDVEPVYEAARAGDIRHSLADLSLATAELGYTPGVLLRDGLNRTIEHYQELRERVPT
jgi:nucleoside-diphosphate-sugar epimerase